MLNITGATADGTAMVVDPVSGGYILPTTNDPADDSWLIHSADGTSASEALANEYFGLYLVAGETSGECCDPPRPTMPRPRCAREPYDFLTYLKAAADGPIPSSTSRARP